MSKKKFNGKKKGFGEENSNYEMVKLTPKMFNKWQQQALMGDLDAQIKVTNFFRNEWNRNSYNPLSTMIHERDYEPMNCCLCGEHMPSIHDTHNPEPFTPKCWAKDALDNNLPHRCCSKCNVKVTEERMKVNDGMSHLVHLTDYFNTHSSDELDKKTGYLVPYFNEEGEKKEFVL